MKRNNIFLKYGVIAIILVVLIFCIMLVVKNTVASFNGVTGNLGNGTKVIYHSNYPDASLEAKYYEYEGADSYKVLSNMFLVPDGYKFSGWGIDSIGPFVYSENQYISVTEDINLYAIWEVILDSVVKYGDVDLNGIIDLIDVDLIDKYLLDNSILVGQSLINADVNVDGKVDIIDLDIVKQVCLGTKGYVGFLPDKPILKYELYVKDNDEDGGNNSSSSGSGTSGGGNGTSNNNGGNRPNNSSNSKPSNSEEYENDKDKVEDKKKYIFKYMNDNMEFASTSCLVLENNTCMLVLPNTVPSKNGYKFIGWSSEVTCSNIIIKETISVGSGNTYYACFSKIKENIDDDKNSFSEWLIVGLIWGISILLIYKVVYNFKLKSN